MQALLAATPYADADIVPVSARTGAGLDDLRSAIQRACDAITRSGAGQGIIRLPIDRVFTVKGAGTVVTGTLWSGTVRVGRSVELLPSHRICRIRSVQRHGVSRECVAAGNRVALNLQGVAKDEVKRGGWVVEVGSTDLSERFDAQVTYRDTAHTGKPLATGVRVHVAHGTCEVVGRLLLCDGKQELVSGESAFAQVRIEKPLAVRSGDRFVIRSYSPVHVVGGGSVLLSHPPRRSRLSDGERAALAALSTGDGVVSQQVIVALLTMREVPMTVAQISDIIDADESAVAACLVDALEAGCIESVGSTDKRCYLTAAMKRRLLSAVERALVEFHANEPEATGCSIEALRGACARRCPRAAFDAVLEDAARRGDLVVFEGEAGLPQAQATAQAATRRAAEELLSMLKEQGAAVPELPQLAQRMGLSLPLARKAAALCEREGMAHRISGGWYLDTASEQACCQAVVRCLEEKGRATVGELREVMGISRNRTVPLLERFDAQGITERVGDVRVLFGR